MKHTNSDLEHLERIRNLCRAALALGLITSLAANIVAAEPTVVGRVVAGWPPLVLLVVVELIGRVSLDTGWLAWVRLGAAGGIAGVAALVSYKHMIEVARLAGEASLEAHLIPLTVDGLVVVASISLIGLNGHIRSSSPKPKPAATPRQTPTDPTNGSAANAGLKALPATTSVETASASERAAKAIELATAGRTQQEIADELGVSVRTVRRDLKEANAA